MNTKERERGYEEKQKERTEKKRAGCEERKKGGGGRQNGSKVDGEVGREEEEEGDIRREEKDREVERRVQLEGKGISFQFFIFSYTPNILLFGVRGATINHDSVNSGT